MYVYTGEYLPVAHRDPLKSGSLSMKKWQDQAWQLVIHVTMGRSL